GAGTRKDIGNLEAELKKGKYGSVLSGYEMKEYPKWGISQKYQEQKNRNALAALKNKAEIELRNLTGGQTGGFSGGGWSLTGRTQ
ncbi:MAG: hypothetical protein U9P50_01775, partial [Patescibacteria group bacterium]|nr:hypothetical protein [Patescibacteria group bacterium]